MISVQIPNLPTLHRTPSWLNARGGVDRSACIEVRVSEARRLAGCVVVDRARRDARRRPLHIVDALPDQKPARFSCGGWRGRIAAGTFTITAHMLHQLHEARPARRLAGDYRTSRANVMREEIEQDAERPRDGETKSRFRFRTRRNGVADPPDIGLPPNPNAGHCRSKVIGLVGGWSQRITIEKWVYPRRIRPAYFFVCPGSIGTNHGGHREHRASIGFAPSQDSLRSKSRSSSVSSVSSVVNLSSRKPGREHPSSKRCPQRCLKLLMIQCTPAEWRDANVARLWLNSIPPLLAKTRAYLEAREALIVRYGPFLDPDARLLVCPRCLGGPACGSGGGSGNGAAGVKGAGGVGGVGGG